MIELYCPYKVVGTLVAIAILIGYVIYMAISSWIKIRKRKRNGNT